MQLSEGKRLKLAALKSASRHKPAPNFDIELATLKCSQSPTSNHVLTDSQSDDDLGNVSELLGRGKHVRSKTDYSNSGVDVLIQNDDDNEFTMCALSSTLTPIRKRALACDDPTTALPPKSSPPRKRLRSGNTTYRPYSPIRDEEHHHQKRFKASLTLFGSPSEKVIC